MSTEHKEEAKKHIVAARGYGDPSVHMSLLSDKAIIEHMRRGSIVIHPFNKLNLSTSRFPVVLRRSG